MKGGCCEVVIGTRIQTTDKFVTFSKLFGWKTNLGNKEFGRRNGGRVLNFMHLHFERTFKSIEELWEQKQYLNDNK